MVLLNFILLFLQANSYNIIDINPFEKYSFSDENKTVLIFKFNNYDSFNSSIIFSRQDFNKQSMKVYFYLEDSIIENEKEEFINYDAIKEFKENSYQQDLIFEYQQGNIFYFVCTFNANHSFNYTIMIYTHQDILNISQNQLNYEIEQCYYFKISMPNLQININDISKYSYLHIQFYQIINDAQLSIIGGKSFGYLKQLNEYIDINGLDIIILKYSIIEPIINRICFSFPQSKIIDIEKNKLLKLYSDGNYTLYYRKNFNFEIIENFNIVLNNCFEPKFYCKNIKYNYKYQIENEKEGKYQNCTLINKKNSNFVIQYKNIFSQTSTFIIKVNCKLINKNNNQLDYISMKIDKVILFQNNFPIIQKFLGIFVFLFFFSILTSILYLCCCNPTEKNNKYEL